MKKIKNYKILSESISNWIKEYAESSNIRGFVVGVSGGVDSAVVSALCAKTGMPTLLLEMPIHQAKDQVSRAQNHINWLEENFINVNSMRIDLSSAYDNLYDTYNQTTPAFGILINKDDFDFSMANTRSRLRMTTLYQFAGMYNLIVVGTGNKVEDFGVGFYTKYGDGGVDISPIADLMKSEVRALADELGVSQEIIQAAPTDGLHEDSRTDEEQLGATYDELEWAMEWIKEHTNIEQGGVYYDNSEDDFLVERQKEVLEIYKERHNSNKHKMKSIPVFKTYKFRENV